MKSLRSSLILLVLALFGGAYLFFAERGAPSRSGALVLFSARAEQIRTIRFAPSGIELRRQDEKWRVFDPKTRRDAPADPKAVESLLQSLEKVESDAPVSNPEKLAVYGLEKPSAQIEIDRKMLSFGASPRFDPRGVYARSDDEIALLPLQLRQTARKSFGEWRDSSILRFDAQTNDFSLQTARGRLGFQKNGEEWRLNPLGVRADADVVNDFLTRLGAAQISRWFDENGANPTKFRLDKPRAVIEIGEAKLEIGARQKEGGFAARNSASPAIWLLPDAVWALIDQPKNHWRDKRVAVFDAESVARLEIFDGRTSRTLLREGDDWRLKGGKNEAKVRNAALDLIDFARGLRATDFAQDATKNSQPDITPPVFALKASDADGAVAFELRFERREKNLFVQSQGSVGTLFKLESSALDAIQIARAQIFAPTK